MEIGIRVPGRAPADVVWERYAQVDRWPQWAPQITAVEAASDRLAPAMTGRVRGPLGVRASFVVTAVDDHARTWAWTAWSGPVKVHLTHGVEPDGSTWLWVRGPALVVVLYLPVARIALHFLTR